MEHGKFFLAIGIFNHPTFPSENICSSVESRIERSNRYKMLCSLKQFVSLIVFTLSSIKFLLQEPNRIFDLSMLYEVDAKKVEKINCQVQKRE